MSRFPPMELKTNSTFQGFRSSKQNCKGLFAMMNATNKMQNCSFQRGGVVEAGGGATQATFLAPGGASLFRFIPFSHEIPSPQDLANAQQNNGVFTSQQAQ